MRKSRAFPTTLAMVATVVASILSVTPTLSQEVEPAADADAEAGDTATEEKSPDNEADAEPADDEAEEKSSDAEAERVREAADAKSAETEADAEPADDEETPEAAGAAEVDADASSAEVAASATTGTFEADAKAEPADAEADDGLTLALASTRIRLRIYGFLNAQLELVQATGGTTPYITRGRISDGNSRLGFAGSIDLTKGIEAIWQLEGGLGNFEQGGINDRGLSAIIVTRNTFVGINHSKAGRLILGYNDSVYRSMIGSAGAFGGNLGLTRTGLDLWNNTSAQMSGNRDSLFSRGEARYANSAHYETPIFYGVQLGASYSFDEVAELARLRNRFSAALTYEYKGFKIGGGYDHQMNTGVDQEALFEGMPFSVGISDEDDTTTRFAKGLASYENTRSKTSVAAGVEYGMYDYHAYLHLDGYTELPVLHEGDMGQLSWMASASQGIVKGLTAMVSGGMLLKLDNALIGEPEDYEAWQVSGGLKYSIGEYFTTYIYYTYIDNSSRQNVNFGQAPLYSNNLGTPDAYLAPGNDPRSLGIGVLARF